jgi:hypothetical protein
MARHSLVVKSRSPTENPKAVRGWKFVVPVVALREKAK